MSNQLLINCWLLSAEYYIYRKRFNYWTY